MKYILHIDTSSDIAVVAVSGDGKMISSRINTEGRNHAAVINTNIEAALDEAGIKLKHLAAVAICGGPGSYTGLRIGMSTAKGLCYALDIPLLMHDRLLLMLLPHLYDDKGKDEVYTAILPAREKEYFIASYSKSFENILLPQHANEDQLEELLNCNGKKAFVLYDEQLKDSTIIKKNHTRSIASNMLDLNSWSAYIYAEYNCNRTVKIDYAEPIYLKSFYTHNKMKNS